MLPLQSRDFPFMMPAPHALPLLLFGLVTIGMGQTIVFAVLPMLGRELGFVELQINALVSAAALMYFLTSPRWGRLSDRWGRKRVILVGLSGYAVGTLVFNAFAEMGLAGWMAGALLFIPLMLSRMLMAGLMSASQPASMAYMADSTTPEQRIRGFSRLSAANNIGTMAGPLLAYFALWGLLVPLYLHAAVALLTLFIIWRWLPDSAQPVQRAAVKRLRYGDRRYRAYLLVGLLMYTLFGVVQQTLGYYFQDTLGLSAQESAGRHGLAMMLSAASMLFAQLVLVQRCGWSPLTLLRIGLPLACLALLGLAWAEVFWALAVSMMLFGLGMGLAGPGYAAGTSMKVGADEQGSIAGLISAAPGLGFVAGPLLGAAAYQVFHALPYLLAAGLYALLALWLWWRSP